MNLNTIKEMLILLESRMIYNFQQEMTRSEHNILSAIEKRSGILPLEQELKDIKNTLENVVKSRDNLQRQLDLQTKRIETKQTKQTHQSIAWTWLQPVLLETLIACEDIVTRITNHGTEREQKIAELLHLNSIMTHWTILGGDTFESDEQLWIDLQAINKGEWIHHLLRAHDILQNYFSSESSFQALSQHLLTVNGVFRALFVNLKIPFFSPIFLELVPGNILESQLEYAPKPLLKSLIQDKVLEKYQQGLSDFIIDITHYGFESNSSIKILVFKAEEWSELAHKHLIQTPKIAKKPKTWLERLNEELEALENVIENLAHQDNQKYQNISELLDLDNIMTYGSTLTDQTFASDTDFWNYIKQIDNGRWINHILRAHDILYTYFSHDKSFKDLSQHFKNVFDIFKMFFETMEITFVSPKILQPVPNTVPHDRRIYAPSPIFKRMLKDIILEKSQQGMREFIVDINQYGFGADAENQLLVIIFNPSEW